MFLESESWSECVFGFGADFKLIYLFGELDLKYFDCWIFFDLVDVVSFILTWFTVDLFKFAENSCNSCDFLIFL